LADPSAGASLLRLLTGARWRIGPRDIVALYRRERAVGVARLGGGDPGPAPEPALGGGPLDDANPPLARAGLAVPAAPSAPRTLTRGRAGVIEGGRSADAPRPRGVAGAACTRGPVSARSRGRRRGNDWSRCRGGRPAQRLGGLGPHAPGRAG